jgi:Bifunctional DNA primase/polymerase, N-terminal
MSYLQTLNKKPLVPWSEWQDKPIPEWQHEKWKSEGAFSRGIAIIPGKVCHREDKKNLYFTFIDADKQKAIEELCTSNEKIISLQEMAQKFLVEQHADNPEKAHIYFYSPIPFPKKSADSVLGLEVKGLGEHGIAFCFPSIHKDGMPYEIIGTNRPITLTVEHALKLIQHIDKTCVKHSLQYLEKGLDVLNLSSNKVRNIIKTLAIDTTLKIPQGQRHVILISIANSLLFSHLGKGKNKSEEWLKDFFLKINYSLCEPEPLPDSEIDNIWNSALNFVTRIREERKDLLSNLREGLGINVVISRNTAGKNKNTSTIRVWKEPPLPPPSLPEANHAQNENKIGGGSLNSGDVTSTGQQESPPENNEIHAQIQESGGSGDGGGFISTLEGGELLHSSPLPTTYIAFDFEWLSSPKMTQPVSSIESVDINSQTQITAAAFVNNQGNSKVLHISDFSNSDNSELELVVAINQELMKYDFSIG